MCRSKQTWYVDLLSTGPHVAVSPDGDFSFDLVSARKLDPSPFNLGQRFVSFFEAVQQAVRLCQFGVEGTSLLVVSRLYTLQDR